MSPPESGAVASAAPPDAVALLARVGGHVYSGEVAPDGEYRETYTGPGTEQLLGGTTEPGIDVTDAWNSAVHPDDREGYRRFGLDRSETACLEYRLVGRDGVTRWVLDQMWVRERLPDGRCLVDGVVTDVSELHERSKQVVEATAWLDAAVTVSPAALILVDSELRVKLWNPAAERMFGWSRDEAIERVAPHVRLKDLARISGSIATIIATDRQVVDEEMTCRTKGGSELVVSVSSAAVRDVDGEITGVLGVLSDMTARKAADDQLRRLAHSDPLTGLANRALLTQRIDEATARLPAAHRGLALLLLDLDGFKAVNDSLGHAVGDELLVAVATRLGCCLRTQDLAARLGGDEFAMLLETVDVAEAIRVAGRILAGLAEPFSLSRAEVVVTASIGLVHVDSDRSTADLLRDADVAMYRAKGDGKNQVVVFEPAMQQRVATRLTLETAMRRAVTAGEFELHYQPFVNLSTGRVVGVEALVRWHHPQRGLLLPAEFIPVAEETGLIVPLGRWILEQACDAASQWQPADPARLLSVAVNLSPRQLHDTELVQVASDSLARTGLPPEALTIEITENLLLGDTALAGARIAELRALGIQVAVDDFGTGYSSLAYLRRYPVDILKIDRSFVSPLLEGARPAALVRSIIDLATALDLDTVAEGVERREQATTLSRLGCHVAQGYFFARPQPAAEIRGLVDRSLLVTPRRADG